MLFYEFHVTSRIQQGRQTQPSVKTLRSPLCFKFRRHCVLNDGKQLRALPRHLREKTKTFNISLVQGFFFLYILNTYIRKKYKRAIFNVRAICGIFAKCTKYQWETIIEYVEVITYFSISIKMLVYSRGMKMFVVLNNFFFIFYFFELNKL